MAKKKPVRLPRGPDVAIPNDPAPTDWTVELRVGRRVITMGWPREETARLYATNAQSKGIWIGEDFVSDPQVTVVPPRA